jgi:hypothetical protein
MHYVVPSYLLLSYKFLNTIMEFFWTWVYELTFDVVFFVKDWNKNATQLCKPHTEYFDLLKLEFHLF